MRNTSVDVNKCLVPVSADSRTALSFLAEVTVEAAAMAGVTGGAVGDRADQEGITSPVLRIPTSFETLPLVSPLVKVSCRLRPRR